MFPCQCCAILEPQVSPRMGFPSLSVPLFLLDPPYLVDMLPRVATINAGPEIRLCQFRDVQQSWGKVGPSWCWEGTVSASAPSHLSTFSRPSLTPAFSSSTAQTRTSCPSGRLTSHRRGLVPRPQQSLPAADGRGHRRGSWHRGVGCMQSLRRHLLLLLLLPRAEPCSLAPSLDALPLPQQQGRVDGPATNPWAVMQGSPALSRWWGFAAVALTPRDCFSGSWCMLCAGRREQNEWQALLQLDTRDRAACRPPHPIGGAAPPAPTRPRGAGPSRRPSACSWRRFTLATCSLENAPKPVGRSSAQTTPSPRRAPFGLGCGRGRGRRPLKDGGAPDHTLLPPDFSPDNIHVHRQ